MILLKRLIMTLLSRCSGRGESSPGFKFFSTRVVQGKQRSHVLNQRYYALTRTDLEIEEFYDFDRSVVTSSCMHNRGSKSETDHDEKLSVLLSFSKSSVDSSFWLLNTGASVNVITKRALQHFQHTEVQKFANRCSWQ